MTHDPHDDRNADEILAERLVDEALLGMALPARLQKIIRVTLLGELLTTPEGRAQLRRASADPTVGSSGEVDKPGAVSAGHPHPVAASARDAGLAPAKPTRRGGGRP